MLVRGHGIPLKLSGQHVLSMTLRASAFLALIAAACIPCSAALAQGASSNDACNVKATSPLVVNVRAKGAKGDGQTDDTAAIQKAINEVGGTGGTVYVPNGIYMVRGTGKNRLMLRSKMVFKMADHATLRVIPTSFDHYSALRIHRVSDVAVVGGTLEGERAQHKNQKGQWGMGIFIGRDTKRVTIVGVTAKDMWGDGFYITRATDVALCSVVAAHNRRQGLSIITANRVLVINSVFRDTRGTRPSAGIDIEPDRPDQLVANIRIERSKFIDNAGYGVNIAGKRGRVANVQILNNVFEGGRPILVENAPRVSSTEICDNRFISQQEQTSEGFNAFAEPVEAIAFQNDCSSGRDMRFEVNRITKKKKKKPSN